MKMYRVLPYYCLFVVTVLFPCIGHAKQTKTPDKKFSISLNSSYNSEVNPYRLTLCGSFYFKKHQFEVGFGFHPFIEKNERVMSGEFHYKYFLNGMDTKFSMYIMASFLYMNRLRSNYYPAAYNYLFLQGGYGFQVRVYGGLYLGTNVSFGAFTNSRESDHPLNNDFDDKNLFEQFGINLELQANIRFRF